jgi:hypothetical protein
MTEATALYRKYLEAPESSRVEALTSEDARQIHARIHERSKTDPELAALFRLEQTLAKQYARGQRCGVCGNTPEQSRALNYDCTYEC